MIRAHTILPDAAGPADLTAELSFDDRHRRRIVVATREGEDVLVDLAEATRLAAGTRIAMEDGRTLQILALDEAVADITAPDPLLVTRLAWHLGNRHTPTAILAGRLRIRRDHGLEAMVERLGGTVTPLSGPFDPEYGAYHDGGGHGHHGHDHHDHAHDDHGHHDHGHDAHGHHDHMHDGDVHAHNHGGGQAHSHDEGSHARHGHGHHHG